MKKTMKAGPGRTLFISMGLICMTLSPAAIPDVSARPFRMGKIPDKGATFGCGTCPVNPRGGGSRDLFGKDYEKIGMPAEEQYTEELGSMDSDGDGHSNDQDFKTGTHPADPDSKPAK